MFMDNRLNKNIFTFNICRYFSSVNFNYYVVREKLNINYEVVETLSTNIEVGGKSTTSIGFVDDCFVGIRSRQLAKVTYVNMCMYYKSLRWGRFFRNTYVENYVCTSWWFIIDFKLNSKHFKNKYGFYYNFDYLNITVESCSTLLSFYIFNKTSKNNIILYNFMKDVKTKIFPTTYIKINLADNIELLLFLKFYYLSFHNVRKYFKKELKVNLKFWRSLIKRGNCQVNNSSQVLVLRWRKIRIIKSTFFCVLFQNYLYYYSLYFSYGDLSCFNYSFKSYNEHNSLLNSMSKRRAKSFRRFSKRKYKNVVLRLNEEQLDYKRY